jgi:hypothetical protein
MKSRASFLPASCKAVGEPQAFDLLAAPPRRWVVIRLQLDFGVGGLKQVLRKTAIALDLRA